MLVLNRQENQAIMIGDNVRITVLKISGNRVSLGIQAPADVRIKRLELSKQSQHEADVIPPGTVDESL